MKKNKTINRLSRQTFSIFLILIFILIHLACPKEEPPEKADCPVGKSPCADDSTACCWDTTSHNFVWEIDTLGDYGSYLNDVAIIDENNVWVVGYIKNGDSTYNAVHWDGSGWELYRLPAVTYSGSISQGALTSIYAIGALNIWCSSDAGSYVRWNGQCWQSEWIQDRNGGINAMWGTSSSNMYFVGGGGSIVHYDGNTFTRIESGIDIPIVDLWGRDENDIYLCQFNSTTGHSGILHYDGNQLESLYYFESIVHNSDTLSGAIHTIWIYGDTLYAGYSSGIWKENIFQKKGVVTFWTKIFSENVYSNKIIGQSNNDIFIVGNWMKMAHYNGVSWKSYANIFGNYGTYEAVDLSENLVCVVGWTDFPKALIVVGKRVM
ncbi:MAG: hypothetical protein H8E08_00590 [Candidatus Marinimicrobia bacterium]|nr:hypothetical protein [Candidatus Neomarinimicrobiota bacterium]